MENIEKTRSYETLDDILSCIITENGDIRGRCKIRLVFLLYEKIYKKWDFSKYQTVSKYFRDNSDKFKFHRVSPGKHEVSVAKGFNFKKVKHYNQLSLSRLKSYATKDIDEDNNNEPSIPVGRVSLPSKHIQYLLLRKTSSFDNLSEKALEEDCSDDSESEASELIIKAVNKKRMSKDDIDIGTLRSKLKKKNAMISKLSSMVVDNKKVIVKVKEKTKEKISSLSCDLKSLKKEVDKKDRLLSEKDQLIEKLQKELAEAKSGKRKKTKKIIVTPLKKSKKKKVSDLNIEYSKDFKERKCELIHPGKLRDIKKNKKNRICLNCPGGNEVLCIVDNLNWTYLKNLDDEEIYDSDESQSDEETSSRSKKRKVFGGMLEIKKKSTEVQILATFEEDPDENQILLLTLKL